MAVWPVGGLLDCRMFWAPVLRRGERFVMCFDNWPAM